MPTIDFVTTTSKLTYDCYGKNNYLNWLTKIKDDRKQINGYFVYSEELDKIQDRIPNINFINLFEKSPNCKIFVDTNSNKDIANPSLRKYKTEFIKFCYKVYAICYHTKISTADYTVWIDSDIYVRAKGMDIGLWFSLCKEKHLLSYLNREKFITGRDYDSVSSETGLIIVNNKHPLKNEFFNRYQNIYDSGEIFNHKEQHDGYIFDRVIEEFSEDNFFKLSTGEIKEPIRKLFPTRYLVHTMGEKKLQGKT